LMHVECGLMNTQHETASPLTSQPLSPLGNGYHRPSLPDSLDGHPSSTSKKKRLSVGLLVALGVFIIAFIFVAAFVAVRYGREWLHPAHHELIWYSVKKESLEVTVVEKGTFEAARNEDLKCQVKATRGGQFATTIRWIVDDGTQVMANRPEDQ